MSFLSKNSQTPSTLSHFALGTESCIKNGVHAGWESHSHYTDGKAEVQRGARSCPRAQSDRESKAENTGLAAAPSSATPDSKSPRLPGSGGGHRKEGTEDGGKKPSQGTGRALWGCGRIINQTQGLALSPLWFKKHLIRLQGPEILSQESSWASLPPSASVPLGTAGGSGPQEGPSVASPLCCLQATKQQGSDFPGRSAPQAHTLTPLHTASGHARNLGSSQSPRGCLRGCRTSLKGLPMGKAGQSGQHQG